jgi:hypothetical protein
MMTDPEIAQAEGCMFYTLPSQLTEDQIDPLIRDIVFRINGSEWVWTAESCQGHPDCEEEMTAWGMNTDPFLRLVTHQDQFGLMMDLLVRSLIYDKDGLKSATGLRCFPTVNHKVETPRWREILVYMPGTNVATRNRSLKCFREFAELVNSHRVFTEFNRSLRKMNQNLPPTNPKVD